MGSLAHRPGGLGEGSHPPWWWSCPARSGEPHRLSHPDIPCHRPPLSRNILVVGRASPNCRTQDGGERGPRATWGERRMSVGIVGLGYVGLPLAVSFAEAGEHVVGIEVNARRVAQLRCGESYIEDVPSEQLRTVMD